jgi:hypothetical protein
MALLSVVFLASCDSSSDDDDSTGALRFYNLSSNSPDLVPAPVSIPVIIFMKLPFKTKTVNTGKI